MIAKKRKDYNVSLWEKTQCAFPPLLTRLCAGMCMLLGLFACADGAIAGEDVTLPEGFCLLEDVAPDIVLSLRYAGSDNFVGRPIAGYETLLGVMTRPAAEALAAAQQAFRAQGLTLVLYDAYRPQRAVEDFAAWAEDPEDTAMQAAYYPDIPKDQLFSLGYIARRSGHSRGSTVDVGLLDAQGNPVDMGCGFDTFGPIAAHGAEGLTKAQQANRTLLRDTMEAHGFRSYSKEWWHYTLEGEPFPDTYFDFPITEALAQRDAME